ncbi:YceI family protein [Mucilaginibacter sp. P19]|uniref:Polyisoprenoid-binding protein YceI n=1 Tax=Mucilaginibacter gossypii TaxID=551996 RepID=A0A1G8HW44_9SPHI|nr:YceI family protein [Mucilaginibacter gossypii]SDI10876.1 Polyisoprenoid-binding protein YceI [Mucilaginibacter gossypii]
METQKFEIISAKSNIDWIGRKVTGAHNGTIAIKEGSLTFADGQLTSGKFDIDTTSIKILDITDPATNAQFAGHLASDDFFNSENYPEAQFVFTAIDKGSNDTYRITGDLTIKGITRAVGFDAQVNRAADTVSATGKVVVDRTKYGMRFRSGNFFKDLGDTLIYNDFDLNVNITAKAV